MCINNLNVNDTHLKQTKNIKPISTSSNNVIPSRSLLKKNSTQSLLKSNYLTQKPNTCEVIQSKKLPVINNPTSTNSLVQKTCLLPNKYEDPKIVIVRKGNSVLTTQTGLTLQKSRVDISPERRLLGGKKNCETLNKSRVNNRKVFDTFDNDVIALKRVLNQLDIIYIIGYALRKIPLYIEPDRVTRVFFDVPTQKEFKDYSLVKQTFLEIQRAKCICSFLKDLYGTVPDVWSYVNILKYSREHGFLPKEHKYWNNINLTLKNNLTCGSKENIDSAHDKKKKESMSSYTDAKSLIEYIDKELKSIPKDIHDTNDEIDIETIPSATKYIEKINVTNNFLLPVLYGSAGECQIITDAATTLGLSFETEQIEDGVNHPSVLEALCSSLRSIVSDIIRKSLGICQREGDYEILPQHIFATLLSRPEFDILTNKYLGSEV